jgi:hypothetical protein
MKPKRPLAEALEERIHKQKRHIVLHQMLDELLVAYLGQPHKFTIESNKFVDRPASIQDPIETLMKWSYEQTKRSQ